jgi:formylglycine-generating enzyme required for sulfatase activity
VQIYREEPDSGVHSIAEWIIYRWGFNVRLKEIEKDLATGRVEGKRWYINRQGQTMVVVANPGEFLMGERQEATFGRKGIEPHNRRIDRTFAIASKEVTVEQSRRFKKLGDFPPDPPLGGLFAPKRLPTTDCPVKRVAWYEAAAYCNWLSEHEGIPKDQWCYEPNDKGQYAAGMKLAPNCLQRKAYRLPTEAEWEYC